MTSNRTTAADTMAARRVLNRLIAATEMGGVSQPDARRVLRDECDALRSAIGTERHDHPERYGDRDALAAAVTEARRVAAMWGVNL